MDISIMKKFYHNNRMTRRSAAIGLSFMILAACLGGCGGAPSGGLGGKDEEAEDIFADAGGADGPSGGVAMGRYLEEVADLSGDLGGYREQLFALADGKMAVTQPMGPMLVSADGGGTWRTGGYDWLDELLEKGTFMEDYAIGADGTVGIVYSDTEMRMGGGAQDDDEEDAGEAEDDKAQGDETENAGKAQGDTAENVGKAQGDDADKSDNIETADQEEPVDDENFIEGTQEDWLDSLRTNALIVRPDGTQIPVRLPAEGLEPQNIWISEEGRIFVGALLSSELYEIGADGSGKVFLTLEDQPKLTQFLGNYLIIDGYNYGGLVIYDMEAEAYVEDAVLNDFVKENYGGRTFNGGSWYDLFFFAGEDGALYLAGDRGVHRHVVGGSAIEQVIDPGLTTFGNPKYGLLGMAACGDSEFMALFTGARMVRYVYDPSVPTVPNERIKAYSLVDNSMLRQAISIYQTRNPEVYVEYVVGMEEGGPVTRDDAVKKVNTEIMAGEGPDLIILDDMPADSYIEKGLLADLAPLVDGLSGDGKLFDNVIDAFRRDAKLYAIPCEASLPTIMGREKYISQMTDLKGIADGMEEIRKDHPEKDILRLCSAKAVMKNFVTVCAPAWVTPEGEIDGNAVEEFLRQMKRVYDAQMDGLPEEYIRQYEQWDAENIEYGGEKLEDEEYYAFGMDDFNYIRGYRQILAGILCGPYSYAELVSVRRLKGFEEERIAPMNGQSSNVFCVSTLAGINASSESIHHAEGLLRVLLGAEDITNLGFPVNRAAFEAQLYPDDLGSAEEPYSTMAYLEEDGKSFIWNVYWFDEGMAEELRKRMETADTPYVKNGTLEEAVYKAGVAYMQGSATLEEAVREVEKSMAIYLAE